MNVQSTSSAADKILRVMSGYSTLVKHAYQALGGGRADHPVPLGTPDAEGRPGRTRLGAPREEIPLGPAVTGPRSWMPESQRPPKGSLRWQTIGAPTKVGGAGVGRKNGKVTDAGVNNSATRTPGGTVDTRKHLSRTPRGPL